ncbi:MAG: hypothetical protein QXN68_00430 [Thermoplasmata archaeon]
MGLSETISKLISIYGLPARIIKRTTVQNEYGDLVQTDHVIINITVLPLNNPKIDYLRRLLGYKEQSQMSFLSTSNQIDIDDEIEILGKTYRLQLVEPVLFKGQVIAYIIKVI